MGRIKEIHDFRQNVVPRRSARRGHFFILMGSSFFCIVLFGINTSACFGFQNVPLHQFRVRIMRGMYSPTVRRDRHPVRASSLFMVTAQPPSWQDEVRPTGRKDSRKQRRPTNNNESYYQKPVKRNSSSRQRYRRAGGSDDDIYNSGRWRRAVQVEGLMVTSLERMREAMSSQKFTFSVVFPSVRECNSALATFGDGGELLRALRLFVKMRKAASLTQRYRRNHNNNNNTLFVHDVPAPTLVTYSTLMSRAVQAGKPQVALRLWKLMTMQTEFSSSATTLPPTTESSPSSSITSVTTAIVPDVKAANILMNVYAKLADVAAAKDLLEQMLHGNGTDVSRMKPNLVTYNTLLDACQKAGELDESLAVKQQLDDTPGLIPDARTYTSLIATVARKASVASGAHDPTLAFTLLQEMNARGVRPNGMTYCALIDVCGRCNRSDLALKGLRIMQRQKAKEQKELEQRHRQTMNHGDSSSNPPQQQNKQHYALSNEVGAWTAAINACGKAGRIETAVRLFYAMSSNFGVKPNTITCGCLTDCLLRNGRIAETLDVLRYMKQENIAPSEVMYTSLMTSAGKLVEVENRKQWELERKLRQDEEEYPDVHHDDDESEDAVSGAKAIQVYTELMKSLMRGTAGRRDTTRSKLGLKQQPGRSQIGGVADEESNTLLLKVFLVFQEMKDAGAQPDLACYNALLRACARAGDTTRAQDVLNRLCEDGLDPNDISWREMIRAAGKSRRSDIAQSTWESALEYRGVNDERILWKPSVATFGALVNAYLRHASSLDSVKDQQKKQSLYQRVASMYDDILSDNWDSEVALVDRERLQENQRIMLMILRAVVSLEQLMYSSFGHQDMRTTEHEMEQKEIAMLRDMGRSIVSLDCFQEGVAPSLRDSSSLNAFQQSRTWLTKR